MTRLPRVIAESLRTLLRWSTPRKAFWMGAVLIFMSELSACASPGTPAVSTPKPTPSNTPLVLPAIVATVVVGNEPLGVAINPTTHRIYVTEANSGTVSVIGK